MATILDLMTARGVVEITPANSDLARPVRALYIGGTGDVAVMAQNGTTAIFKGFPAGEVLLVECKQVLATGTTATDIVGLT